MGIAASFTLLVVSLSAWEKSDTLHTNNKNLKTFLILICFMVTFYLGLKTVFLTVTDSIFLREK